MYVTRPLSQVLKSPEFGPLDGPNSGCLVIQDEESETYSCFGLCRNRRLKLLPFPQDKELLVRYTTTNGQTTTVSEDPVFLIPVINQPLDSNRYYAIVPHGKRKGEAYTCSREDDKTTCCFCRFVKDVKPMPLDPQNTYQQFQIAPYEELCSRTGGFIATSIALDDGFPPSFLRRKGWTIHTKTPHNFKLDTANGLDPVLRSRLPNFDFPISLEFSEPLVIGKWYSPFVFVKEGTLHKQVKGSLYYEWTLEQRWERIFACRNESNDNRVVIDDVFEDERAFVGGVRGEWDEKSSVDGVVWYVGYGSGGERKTSVGLRVEIVERMRWEESRGGWVGGAGGPVRVSKVEECEGWDDVQVHVVLFLCEPAPPGSNQQQPATTISASSTKLILFSGDPLPSLQPASSSFFRRFHFTRPDQIRSAAPFSTLAPTSSSFGPFSATLKL
ncbi:Protein of unknown function (DUF1262 [Striga hermonthica]|uniref:DUF1262 family protein n=1 Tax=Striga hermonthica TaxID=68872 RepID=A0A9N7RD33_STRHE|nr:Protein of unknown function (DUF1262 [Striga hermonthica]